MSQRPARWRFAAMLWATLALLTPALGAVADGRLAAQSAGSPVAHVESSTTAKCPQVHAPDCAVCRYLSGTAATDAAPVPSLANVAQVQAPQWQAGATNTPGRGLPQGRAPPLG